MDRQYLSFLGNKPFARMLELNIKTWQELKFPDPGDYLQCSSAHDLLVKQTRQMIFNNYKLLEYIQQSVLLFGNQLLDESHNVRPIQDKKTINPAYAASSYQASPNAPSESLNPKQKHKVLSTTDADSPRVKKTSKSLGGKLGKAGLHLTNRNKNIDSKFKH